VSSGGEELRDKRLREECSISVVTAFNALFFEFEATIDSAFEHARWKVLRGSHVQSPGFGSTAATGGY
jgi:hypothetical protein